MDEPIKKICENCKYFYYYGSILNPDCMLKYKGPTFEYPCKKWEERDCSFGFKIK